MHAVKCGFYRKYSACWFEFLSQIWDECLCKDSQIFFLADYTHHALIAFQFYDRSSVWMVKFLQASVTCKRNTCYTCGSALRVQRMGRYSESLVEEKVLLQVLWPVCIYINKCQEMATFLVCWSLKVFPVV